MSRQYSVTLVLPDKPNTYASFDTLAEAKDRAWLWGRVNKLPTIRNKNSVKFSRHFEYSDTYVYTHGIDVKPLLNSPRILISRDR